MNKRIIYSIFGIGALSVAVATTTALTIGGGKSLPKIVNNRDRVYRWNCHKWLIGNDPQTLGDLYACRDTREAKGSSSDHPLVFVLWLLPNTQGITDERGLYLEVQQLKVETGGSISFTLLPEGNKHSDKKFNKARGLYWKDASRMERHPELKLEQISGKNLKESCKLETTELICGDFKAPLEEQKFRNIKLSY